MQTASGSALLALRLTTLLLVFFIVRLPVNDLLRYGLLLGAVIVIFTSPVTVNGRRWLGALFAAAAIFAVLTAWPAPRLDEGYRFYLPGSRADIEASTPPDVARVLTQQFDAEYPLQAGCSGCDAAACQKADASPSPRNGFSADAIYDRPLLSRRTTGIGFSDPVHLRLGDINDLTYNRLDNWCRGIQRFNRDRNSLNLFDRFRFLFPLYLTYQFPPDFVGSQLCWRGTMMWPRGDAGYDAIEHKTMDCRALTSADAGRLIYAISIKRGERLAMDLQANSTVEVRRAVEIGMVAAGVVAVLLLLLDIKLRALRLPVTLVGLALLLIAIIDINFIGGLRPLDDGDDGFAYEGYARRMVQSVMNGDLVAAFRGEESVYYFTPGFRYFRMLEHFVFGDTYLGYLSVMLALPFLVLMLFRRFVSGTWALIITLMFTAVPLGVLFGSSLTQYIVWAARGFADPFAFVLLFTGILLIVPRSDDEDRPFAATAFAGAVLLAMATFCRPNLLLASGVMIAGACLMAITQRQFTRLAALLGGFATLIVSPFHNYYFARSTVLFSDNVNQPETLLMSPLDYLKAAGEILRLDFGGTHVLGAFRQISAWLSGASEFPGMIPLHAAAIVVLIRVSIFGSKFNRWLRLIAFAALVQHGIGACYVTRARYSLGTWLLTVLVCAAWTQIEGLHLFDRYWPGLRSRWAQTRPLKWVGAAIGQIDTKLNNRAFTA